MPRPNTYIWESVSPGLVPAVQAMSRLLSSTTIAVSLLLLSFRLALTVLPFIWRHVAWALMLLSIWQCHFSLRSWRCYKLSLFLQRLHMSGFCSGWQFVSNTYQVVSALPTTGNSPPSPGCTLGRRRPLQRVWRPLWWGPAPVQRGEEGQTAPLIASHLANKEFFREKAYCCLWC